MVVLTFLQQRLYDLVLPAGSQGRHADNPDQFELYFSGKRDRYVIPHITLAKIVDTSELTWHFVCDRVTLRDVIGREVIRRDRREEVASLHRKKQLHFVEAACGLSLEWYMLDEISGSLVAQARRELFTQIKALYGQGL